MNRKKGDAEKRSVELINSTSEKSVSERGIAHASAHSTEDWCGTQSADHQLDTFILWAPQFF